MNSVQDGKEISLKTLPRQLSTSLLKSSLTLSCPSIENFNDLKNILFLQPLVNDLTWYQSEDNFISSKIIQNRFEAENNENSPIFYLHQKFKNNFGSLEISPSLSQSQPLSQSSDFGGYEIQRNNSFKLYFKKSYVTEQELNFNKRKIWLESFFELILQNKQFYSFNYDQTLTEQSQRSKVQIMMFHVENKYIIINKTTHLFRSLLKNYGIKYTLPFKRNIKKILSFQKISHLQDILATKSVTDNEGYSQGESSEVIDMIYDNSEESLIVVKGDMNFKLFQNFYFNSIVKRQGTQSLPLLINKEYFKNSIEKKINITVKDKTKFELKGILFEEKIIQFKQNLNKIIKSQENDFEVKLSGKVYENVRLMYHDCVRNELN